MDIHKAYTFNYESFKKELEPILLRSLNNGNNSEIKEFMKNRFSQLTDPYEGNPLSDDWENQLIAKDPHQYGNIALTYYYDPKEDIGLDYDWVDFSEYFEAKFGNRMSPILGFKIGTEERDFDPGKLGSFFQSPEIVKSHLKLIQILKNKDPKFELLSQVEEMLLKAAKKDTGLYATF
jgi:hypothetical protein